MIVSASVIAGPLPCYFQNHHLYIPFSLGVAASLPLSKRVEERMDFLVGESEEPRGLGGCERRVVVLVGGHVARQLFLELGCVCLCFVCRGARGLL